MASKRPITSADYVAFRFVGDPGEGTYVDLDQGYNLTQWLNGNVALFSPDGSRAAVVVRYGDVASDETRSSILIFETSTLFSRPAPRIVAQFATRSVRPPIQQLKWLADGRRLAFIGEGLDDRANVYLVDTRRGQLTQLTRFDGLISNFDITPSGSHVAFIARSEQTAQPGQRGRVVEQATFTDALAGRARFDFSRSRSELFVQQAGRRDPRRIPQPRRVGVLGSHAEDEFVIGRCNPMWGSLAISPDGRFIARTCTIIGAPPRWARYMSQRPGAAVDATSTRSVVSGLFDSALERALARGAGAAEASSLQLQDDYLRQSVLFDTARGTAALAIDAPQDPAASVGGSSRSFRAGRSPRTFDGSNHLLIANALAPRNDASRGSRLSAIDLTTGRVESPIDVPNYIASLSWDPVRSAVLVETVGTAGQPGPSIVLARDADGWTAREVTDLRLPNSNGVIVIEQRESLNERPVLTAVDRRTGQSAPIYDPNAWLDDVQLGRVATFDWSWGGMTWQAGMYLPPGYRNGERYPVVIQTHGFQPGRFSLYGDSSTGMAAQTLAASGIIVLQIGSLSEGSGRLTADLDPNQAGQRRVEALVEALVSRGIADPARIGLSCYSSTCGLVRHMLVHSDLVFGAAVIADGFDYGYLQYLANPTSQALLERDDYGYGGPPTGAALEAWLERSPAFNAGRVRTPVRIEAFGEGGLPSQWEFFAMLHRLRRPVELYFDPSGSHEAIRPSQWLASAEGTLDWYRFWLQGVEDQDPRKANQYARWRQLREQHRAALASPRPPLLDWRSAPVSRR